MPVTQKQILESELNNKYLNPYDVLDFLLTRNDFVIPLAYIDQLSDLVNTIRSIHDSATNQSLRLGAKRLAILILCRYIVKTEQKFSPDYREGLSYGDLTAGQVEAAENIKALAKASNMIAEIPTW
jgi:hypothetical protein